MNCFFLSYVNNFLYNHSKTLEGTHGRWLLALHFAITKLDMYGNGLGLLLMSGALSGAVGRGRVTESAQRGRYRRRCSGGAHQQCQ